MLEEGLTTDWTRFKELAAKETLDSPAWRIPVKQSGDLDVVKYFEAQPTVAVRPVDRMMALWSHLVTRKEGAQDTIDFIIGSHKQGARVLERMWTLQATFFTMKWGLFTLKSGSQVSREVDKKQSEEAKQAHDKESGKRRDNKKAALQKGPKVPPGKTSVRKGDGRDGEFN